MSGEGWIYAPPPEPGSDAEKKLIAEKMKEGSSGLDHALINRLAMQFAGTPERREYLSSVVLGKGIPDSLRQKAEGMEYGQKWLDEYERDPRSAIIVKLLLASFLGRNRVYAKLLGRPGRMRLLSQAEFDFDDDVEALQLAAGVKKVREREEYPAPSRTFSEFSASKMGFVATVPPGEIEAVKKALKKKNIEAKLVPFPAGHYTGPAATSPATALERSGFMVYVHYDDTDQAMKIIEKMRKANPIVSYHGRRGPVDKFTSRVHAERVGPDADLNVEVWDNKKKMMEFRAEEVALTDVERRKNPWFLGYRNHGPNEIFHSVKIPTPESHPMYLATVGPYDTHQAIEVQAPLARLVGDPNALDPAHGWEPLFRRPKRSKNPGRGERPPDVPDEIWNDEDFQEELAAYYKRHGRQPVEIRRVKVPDGYPKYMSAWGKAPDVKYDSSARSSNKGKRIHHFGEGGKDKPWLASSSARGPKFLAYVGGDFKADGDWIID